MSGNGNEAPDNDNEQNLSVTDLLLSDEIICDSQNITNCLRFLTQEMKNLGLIPYTSDNFTHGDLIGLANYTFKLLKLCHQTSQERQDLHDRLLRAVNDLHSAQSVIARCKEMADQRERIIATLQENERYLSVENTNFTNKLKAAEVEIKRLNSVVQTRDAQLRNDLRKQEREINKLKDRIRSFLSDKNGGERRFGMDLSSALPRKDGSPRAKWKTATNEKKQEEEFYENVIRCLEERLTYLTEENDEMREIVSDVHRQIAELVQEKLVKEQSDMTDDNDCRVPIRLKESHFRMPRNLLLPLLKDDFRFKVKMLKTCLNSIDNKT